MQHASNAFEPDADGWYPARCTCGWDMGHIYPTAEDACDALMDHAYERGWTEHEVPASPVVPPETGDEE